MIARARSADGFVRTSMSGSRPVHRDDPGLRPPRFSPPAVAPGRGPARRARRPRETDAIFRTCARIWFRPRKPQRRPPPPPATVPPIAPPPHRRTVTSSLRVVITAAPAYACIERFQCHDYVNSAEIVRTTFLSARVRQTNFQCARSEPEIFVCRQIVRSRETSNPIRNWQSYGRFNFFFFHFLGFTGINWEKLQIQHFAVRFF